MNVKNSMGDIIGITDIAGNLVVSYTYDAWGNVTSVTGSNTVIGELNPFRYRSYYYDSDIQMYYLQSRYYDPEIGRFINSDDVNFIGVNGSKLSYNAFAYCQNNPIKYIDYDGKSITLVLGTTAISLYAACKAIAIAITGIVLLCSVQMLYYNGTFDLLATSLNHYVILY